MYYVVVWQHTVSSP